MQFWPIPAIFWVLQSNHEIAADGMSIIHPKAYLQASFEVFILMLSLCWILTAWFNPAIMDSNRIRDVFGYNNVCVGFDTVPARYFAQPLMCLQGYYGIRYVALDNLRSELEKQTLEMTRGRTISYWFTQISNCLYSATMLLWGMLLICLPEGEDFTYHFYIYAIFVVIMYSTILGNFVESYVYEEPVSKLSQAWCVLFGIETVLLLFVGTVGFNGYDYVQCPSTDRNKFIAAGTFARLCIQEPTIPIEFMSVLDYGWFILLAFTPFMLPDSPPLIFEKLTLCIDKDFAGRGNHLWGANSAIDFTGAIDFTVKSFGLGAKVQPEDGSQPNSPVQCCADAARKCIVAAKSLVEPPRPASPERVNVRPADACKAAQGEDELSADSDAQADFDVLDANSDGVVDQAEFTGEVSTPRMSQIDGEVSTPRMSQIDGEDSTPRAAAAEDVRPTTPVCTTRSPATYTEAGGKLVGNQSGLELTPSLLARVRGDRPPTRAQIQQSHQACGLLKKHQAEHRKHRHSFSRAQKSHVDSASGAPARDERDAHSQKSHVDSTSGAPARDERDAHVGAWIREQPSSSASDAEIGTWFRQRPAKVASGEWFSGMRSSGSIHMQELE